MEERTRTQHAGSAVQGHVALESYIPVVCATDNVAGSSYESGEYYLPVAISNVVNHKACCLRQSFSCDV